MDVAGTTTSGTSSRLPGCVWGTVVHNPSGSGWRRQCADNGKAVQHGLKGCDMACQGVPPWTPPVSCRPIAGAEGPPMAATAQHVSAGCGTCAVALLVTAVMDPPHQESGA